MVKLHSKNNNAENGKCFPNNFGKKMMKLPKSHKNFPKIIKIAEK